MHPVAVLSRHTRMSVLPAWGAHPRAGMTVTAQASAARRIESSFLVRVGELLLQTQPSLLATCRVAPVKAVRLRSPACRMHTVAASSGHRTPTLGSHPLGLHPHRLRQTGEGAPLRSFVRLMSTAASTASSAKARAVAPIRSMLGRITDYFDRMGPDGRKRFIAKGFGHIGFTASACSLAVVDMLHLRMLSMFSSGAFFIFNYAAGVTPNWVGIGWGVVFTIINLTQLSILALDRFSDELDEESAEVYKDVFQHYGITPGEFRRLYALAKWKDIATDQSLCSQNDELTELYLVVSGTAVVFHDGKPVGEVEQGQFVGEMVFLETREAATATVTATSPLKVLAWSHKDLRHLYQRRPLLARAWANLLSFDLAGKLANSNDERVSKTHTLYTNLVSSLLYDAKEVSEDDTKFLARFRKTNAIADDYHEKAVTAAGWTPSEYQTRKRSAQK